MPDSEGSAPSYDVVESARDVLQVLSTVATQSLAFMKSHGPPVMAAAKRLNQSVVTLSVAQQRLTRLRELVEAHLAAYEEQLLESDKPSSKRGTLGRPDGFFRPQVGGLVTQVPPVP